MIAGIVLAAGESTRMGRPKQLMQVGQTTMLNRVVDAALASKLDAVYVVLGHLADEVGASLRDPSRVSIVRNADYKDGLGSSVRAGVAALPEEADAAMFLLADQPFLSAGLLDQLIARATPGNIVAPSLAGERKNPTVFGRAFFPELLHVAGDFGGRTVIQAHLEALELVELAGDYGDFDTPEDAARLASGPLT
jgi:molybdenum cofactor cytidylyltransferase